MKKELFKAGNMLYPLPVVMVSCSDGESSDNIITVAWAGTVCTNPPMLTISIRPERFSYKIIKESKEFVINLTTEALAKATDFCGVRSGKNVDKFKDMKLTKEKAINVSVPLIGESPVNIECKVKEIKKLGSHDMFLAEVVAVHVSKELINERGKFELNSAKPLVYSHGEYYGIGNLLGTFGYSVKKDSKVKKEIKVEENKKKQIIETRSKNKVQSHASKEKKSASIENKRISKKRSYK